MEDQIIRVTPNGGVYYYPTTQSFTLSGYNYGRVYQPPEFAGTFTGIAGALVKYVSNTPGICTVDSVFFESGDMDAVVTLLGTGTCKIVASAKATECFNAASVTYPFTIKQAPAPVFTVTTLTDDATGIASHCTNQALTGATKDASCSLRDAIAAGSAAYHTTPALTPTVNFSSSLQANGATISTSNPGTYTLTGGPLSFDQEGVQMNIVGPGVGVLKVSGANNYRVISVSQIGGINISGLTITGGNAGGIYLFNNSNLFMDHCIVSGNNGTNGGGIDLGGASTITIKDSTISGNTATNGGGIYVGQGSEAHLYYTTVSGNTISSGGLGAGIYSGHPSGSEVELYNSTVSGNYINGTSGSGAGIYANYWVEVALLSNSIVSGNWIGTSSTVSLYDDLDDGSGVYTYSSVSSDNGNKGGNVVGEFNTQSATAPSPAIHLAPLSFYSGLTETMLPLPPSPAICAGLVANIPSDFTTDQRGLPNTNNYYTNYTSTPACVDAGSVQTDYSVSFTAANSAQPATPEVVNQPFFDPSPAVTLFESGNAFADGRDPIAISLTLSGTGPLGGRSAQTVDVITDPLAGVATYPNLTVGHAGTGDSLAAILTLNSSVTPVPSVSSGSSSFDVGAPVLVFGTAPPDPLTAGGRAGTVTVQVQDGSGDVVTTARDAITLRVTGPNGYSRNYNPSAPHPVDGVATFNASAALTAAGTYTYTVSMDGASDLTATETVTAASAHSIIVAGGSGQSAAIGAAYATALTVTVQDTYANPVSGATVTFTPPASGASAMLTTPAATDVNGQTSVTATANGTAGTYTVTAAVTGVATPASFSLTNSAIAPTLSISCYNGPYDSNPHTCTGTATGIGGVTVDGTWSFNPGSETAANSYPETGTFTSTNSSYTSGGTAANTLTITAIAPTLSISCYSGPYDGNPHTCTGTATGIGGVTVGGTWSLNPGSETAANSYPEKGTFTSTNGNYTSGGTASNTLTITAIAPTLSISCYSGPYDGNQHTCTGTATGIGGVTVGGTWSLNPGSETAANSYPETGTFTSTNGNYTSGGTASNTLTITAIAPTLSISCYNGPYDSNPHTCTGTATGIGGVTVGGTWSLNPGSQTAANSYPETGTFTSTNSSYRSGGTASNTLTIARVPLTVTANNTSMTMGAAVPALTYGITGFAGTDTSSVVSGIATETTTASSSSSAGTYPITFSVKALTAANYTFTYVNGSITVVQAPAASLTASGTVSGSASAGYTVTITIRNTGSGPAANVTLATATLGSASGTPLPQNLGTIAAGASGTFTVHFPGSVGADGAAVAEKYTGTYTGGTFTGSVRAVTLP